jgi:hypothetical protein
MNNAGEVTCCRPSRAAETNLVWSAAQHRLFQRSGRRRAVGTKRPETGDDPKDGTRRGLFGKRHSMAILSTRERGQKANGDARPDRELREAKRQMHEFLDLLALRQLRKITTRWASPQPCRRLTPICGSTGKKLPKRVRCATSSLPVHVRYSLAGKRW